MNVCDPTSGVRDLEKGVIALEAVGDNLDSALGQLLQSFRTYLLTVAAQKLSPALRRKCGASDVVQDTFSEAHRDWHAFRGDTATEVRAWLRGILLNNIRDVARKYGQIKRRSGLEVPIGRDAHDELVDPELTPRACASAQEESRVVADAIAALPDDYRRVIELRSRDNRSFHEIGRLLGRSPDAARMLWFRAIESLRRGLVEPDAT
jgi:RNA polymerase sigma-70 factor, ECF subfamily